MHVCMYALKQVTWPRVRVSCAPRLQAGLSLGVDVMFVKTRAAEGEPRADGDSFLRPAAVTQGDTLRILRCETTPLADAEAGDEKGGAEHAVSAARGSGDQVVTGLPSEVAVDSWTDKARISVPRECLVVPGVYAVQYVSRLCGGRVLGESRVVVHFDRQCRQQNARRGASDTAVCSGSGGRNKTLECTRELQVLIAQDSCVAGGNASGSGTAQAAVGASVDGSMTDQMRKLEAAMQRFCEYVNVSFSAVTLGHAAPAGADGTGQLLRNLSQIDSALPYAIIFLPPPHEYGTCPVVDACSTASTNECTTEASAVASAPAAPELDCASDGLQGQAGVEEEGDEEGRDQGAAAGDRASEEEDAAPGGEDLAGGDGGCGEGVAEEQEASCRVQRGLAYRIRAAIADGRMAQEQTAGRASSEARQAWQDWERAHPVHHRRGGSRGRSEEIVARAGGVGVESGGGAVEEPGLGCISMATRVLSLRKSALWRSCAHLCMVLHISARVFISCVCYVCVCVCMLTCAQMSHAHRQVGTVAELC